MSDVALRPTFPEKELQRVREELLTSLLQAQDDPASLIQFAFPRLVFGPQHRYGTMSIGTAASLKGFTVADLRQFHARIRPVERGAHRDRRRHARSASSRSSNRVRRLEGDGAGTPTACLPRPQLTARQVYLIDKPGAAQSQIRIGWVGVPRSTPDYFALRVLNTILGGAFTSRLNTNLREEHGYAYGASSTVRHARRRGAVLCRGRRADRQDVRSADASSSTSSTAIRKPIPADELDKAKNYLALLLPRNFETTETWPASLAQMFVYNLPADYYATYTDRVRAVTAADVQRVAQNGTSSRTSSPWSWSATAR